MQASWTGIDSGLNAKLLQKEFANNLTEMWAAIRAGWNGLNADLDRRSVNVNLPSEAAMAEPSRSSDSENSRAPDRNRSLGLEPAASRRLSASRRLPAVCQRVRCHRKAREPTQQLTAKRPKGLATQVLAELARWGFQHCRWLACPYGLEHDNQLVAATRPVPLLLEPQLQMTRAKLPVIAIQEALEQFCQLDLRRRQKV